MRNTSRPEVDEEGELIVQPSVVAKNSETIATQYRVAQFRGRAMVEVYEPFPHFVPLRRERFDRLAYPLLGGVTRSRMGDVMSFLANAAEDLTANDHLISFGIDLPTAVAHPELNGGNVEFSEKNRQMVWDMAALQWTVSEDPKNAVWRSPYPRVQTDDPEPVEFVMQLAGGDEELYDDIMQSLAPLVMARKPDGVIWWVGDGANGKSTLMDAIYKIFPGQLSSINVKRLTDGRDTPSLNGTLSNVVKESSEGRIDDTEVYKSLGTHENFRVHKFHSQDDIEIRGDLHHIFSANQIPTFNDKGYSARRRTFIIPFGERFESDPSFEEKVFTPELFGRLIAEMCRYAIKLRDQKYRYKWSAKTLAAKADYDASASNAEEYAKDIIRQGVVAFDSFNPVKIDYENWCADMGYVPLGMGNLRRAMQAAGFEALMQRATEGTPRRIYRIPSVDSKDLQLIGVGRPGLFTTAGFEKPEPPKPEPVPDFNDVEPKVPAAGKHKW